MNYNATLNEFQQIIQWLGTDDEDGWTDQTSLAEEVLSDVTRMATSQRRPDKGPVQIVLGDPKMRQALPYLQGMVQKMRQQDRRRALEQAEAASKVIQG